MAAPEAQFGKYKLLAKIAAGGMAIAYRAELSGAAGVRKRVVLKVIHPHLAQEKNFIQMFISEAKVAASLTHGNIAQVFDFGQIDGRYYISMEEVVGQPLSRVLKAAREKGFARLPVPLALQICVGVLDGLHYAHTRKDETGKALNLVHRDVTPDNVLLSYEGEVKVVDFGIAKTTFSVDMTEAGMVRGKYPYLAPEQASGSRELDARADIWAVGVQLFDLLCGRRPFEGEFLHVMKEIVNPAPVPSLRQYAPGLDPALDAIILGALEKPRDKRWATAREFSFALTNYLHQHYPGSTRQEVQFLLATLFSAEAAREGADVTVPPSFAQDLLQASAKVAPPLPRPAPPVPTEPPAPALPRLTAAESSPVLGPVDDDESTGIEAELEEATRGLLPHTDEEPTLSGIPTTRHRPVERATAAKKKSESDKKLKVVEPGPPRTRPHVPPEQRGAPLAHEATEAASQQDVAARLAEPRPRETKTRGREAKEPAPEPGPPPRKPTGEREVTDPGPLHLDRETQEVQQQLVSTLDVSGGVPLSAVEDVSTRANLTPPKRRTGFVAALAAVGLGTVAAGGFFAWSTLSAEPARPVAVQLWVTSSPRGATIKVDGVASAEKTPGAASVLPGEHSVVVELTGYAPWKKTVNVAANVPINLNAELELVGTAAEADAGAVAAVDGAGADPDEPAALVAPPPVGEANLAKWPKRFHTLRLAKMALPLDGYETLRIELNPKTAYSLSTQGSVNLGKGRSTSALLYLLELEGPGAGKAGVLTPAPKTVKGARAVRVFVPDDDVSDNVGTMRVVARISQYVPEKTWTFDAAKHALVVRPEHQYRIEGMNEETEYLVFSRVDLPQLNKNKEGKVGEVLCISETAKPRPLAKAARAIPFGQKVTLDATGALSCLFPDDLAEDNSGSVELDIVDAAQAAAEGVVAKQYAPAGKW